MRPIVIAGVLLASAAGPLAAQAAPPANASTSAPEFNAEEARAVVSALAAALEENFVFPEVGSTYARMLRSKLDGGAYGRFASKAEFAEAVTADLQAVHKDGHLRLFAPKVPGQKSKFRTAPSANGAIARSGWIADGVAYIEFTMFPSDPATLEKLRRFLDAHSSAKTLIVDIRGHHGGDIAEIDLIASYLISQKTELAHLDTRSAVDAAGGSPFADGPNMIRIEGPESVVRRAHVVTPAEKATGLRSSKIYLLTSKRTVSAAEHLTMAFKRIGRATIVGETTRGAGHFGNNYPLPGGYSAFIPVGRSFDPGTGEGWEGSGVIPDVGVPAANALDEALRLAGVDLPGEMALAKLK